MILVDKTCSSIAWWTLSNSYRSVRSRSGAICAVRTSHMGRFMPGKAEHLLGQQLAGYRLLEILGRGGMSLVFLAERLDNPQERVAIKILMPPHTTIPDELISFQTRFLREAQTVHQLHHEHILPVLDYGEAGDTLYMIMPTIAGG